MPLHGPAAPAAPAPVHVNDLNPNLTAEDTAVLADVANARLCEATRNQYKNHRRSAYREWCATNHPEQLVNGDFDYPHLSHSVFIVFLASMKVKVSWCVLACIRATPFPSPP